jgi:AcrR family transcriptional regulator
MGFERTFDWVQGFGWFTMRMQVARPKAKGCLPFDRTTPHYDRKLEGILRQAAALFCAQGYHQASMRDIARTTGVSLAGLYYYFPSKEHLLYLIQSHALETLKDVSRPWSVVSGNGQRTTDNGRFSP